MITADKAIELTDIVIQESDIKTRATAREALELFEIDILAATKGGKFEVTVYTDSKSVIFYNSLSIKTKDMVLAMLVENGFKVINQLSFDKRITISWKKEDRKPLPAPGYKGDNNA